MPSTRKKILMINTVKGADDHIHIHTYHKDTEYEVSKGLAHNFVHEGHATYIDGAKAKQSHENKALAEDDYLNKAEKTDKPTRRERR